MTDEGMDPSQLYQLALSPNRPVKRPQPFTPYRLKSRPVKYPGMPDIKTLWIVVPPGTYFPRSMLDASIALLTAYPIGAPNSPSEPKGNPHIRPDTTNSLAF